jgi:hypothetical protein
MVGINLVDVLTSTSLSVSNSKTLFGEGYYNQKMSNGGITDIVLNYPPGSYYSLFEAPLAFSTKAICLGTGDADVTYDDYRLSGDVIPNNLVEVSKNITYNATTHKFKRTLVATYTNTSDADITISEWGWWRYNALGSNTEAAYSNASNEAALVYRAVLDDPIVIEAGTTATLTFSIDIPMPNHP